MIAVDQASMLLQDNTVRNYTNYIPSTTIEKLFRLSRVIWVDNLLDDDSYVQTTVDQDIPLEYRCLRDDPNYMPLETD